MDSKHGGPDRRRLLKTALIGGVATSLVLPSKWTKPIVKSVIVPAHAAASPSPTTTPLPPSDVRLKEDITPLMRLDNGIGLYRYRYKWNPQFFVGVMAQEVAGIVPTAVARGSDGYLRVDYGQLGLSLKTWDEWVSDTLRQMQ